MRKRRHVGLPLPMRLVRRAITCSLFELLEESNRAGGAQCTSKGFQLGLLRLLTAALFCFHSSTSNH